MDGAALSVPIVGKVIPGRKRNQLQTRSKVTKFKLASVLTGCYQSCSKAGKEPPFNMTLQSFRLHDSV